MRQCSARLCAGWQPTGCRGMTPICGLTRSTTRWQKSSRRILSMDAGMGRCGLGILSPIWAWPRPRHSKLLSADLPLTTLKPRRKLHAFSNFMTPTFRERLLAWYDEHARDLPWRQSRDPYRVWLSEIMLQQTRVAAVIAHYREFLRRFPSVEKLAAAGEASVLAAWSGLGYYRRARMLHAAAKVVTRDHEGKFPETIEGLRELPGIGRYTAAAISSIAFGEPVAVVDGNVERVLQRLLGKRLAGEELWEAAGGLRDPGRRWDFDQAMMA